MNIGREAETWACQHIQQRSWQIITRNFGWSGGEIDIVATQADQLAFIEVRYRRNQVMGGAIASVDLAKQRRILNTAKFFCSNISVIRNISADLMS